MARGRSEKKIKKWKGGEVLGLGSMKKKEGMWRRKRKRERKD